MQFSTTIDVLKFEISMFLCHLCIKQLAYYRPIKIRLVLRPKYEMPFKNIHAGNYLK